MIPTMFSMGVICTACSPLPIILTKAILKLVMPTTKNMGLTRVLGQPIFNGPPKPDASRSGKS